MISIAPSIDRDEMHNDWQLWNQLTWAISLFCIFFTVNRSRFSFFLSLASCCALSAIWFSPYGVAYYKSQALCQASIFTKSNFDSLEKPMKSSKHEHFMKFLSFIRLEHRAPESMFCFFQFFLLLVCTMSEDRCRCRSICRHCSLVNTICRKVESRS